MSTGLLRREMRLPQDKVKGAGPIFGIYFGTVITGRHGRNYSGQIVCNLPDLSYARRRRLDSYLEEWCASG